VEEGRSARFSKVLDGTNALVIGGGATAVGPFPLA
jgi:hypothetical protein